VPAAAGIAAADSGALVRVDQTGARHAVASTSGVPFRLAVDGDGGGVVYLKRAGKDQVQVRRVTAATLATGSLVDVDVTASHGGQVFVTGKARRTAAALATVSIVDTPKGTPLSLQGKLALTSWTISAVDGRERWIHARGAVAQGPGGERKFVGTVRDITAEKEAENHRRLLSAELQHRIKNTLAVVQAIVSHQCVSRLYSPCVRRLTFSC